MHRDLRILDLRAGDDSPLRTLFLPEAQKTFPSPWLPTPRHPQSGRNVTFPTRSPPFIAGCSSRSPARCRAAHAAHGASRERCAVFYDTVRLTELAAKGLEMLAEALPQTRRIGVLWNP